MHSNTEIAETLEKAADLYESEQIEWCRHQAFKAKQDPSDKVSACALGAISLASGMYQFTRHYVKLVNGQSLGLRAPGYGGDLYRNTAVALATYLNRSVPGFNDKYCKSKQEIIDTMKDCAKELRNAE